MLEPLIIGVIALLVIAAATSLGPRFGLASPLILVLLGIVVSFLPFVPDFELDPEWILAGVLPPLLYSASVSMPAMNFRREFAAISGLSVVLVVASSFVLGLFFAWVIPGLGLGWGVALGAIVSPTDAVATSIAKRTGVAPRVIAILEGESLLNDATALVLLRTAIASVAAAVSIWGVLGQFVFSVALASVIGYLVGRLNLMLRARVSDPTVNTVISFTVPFIASIPAEFAGASGLVAAVVAGLITGRRAPRVLSPQHRQADSQNWRTVELVLEGLVFLIMGLELDKILTDVTSEHAGVGVALLVAMGALLLTIVVRAAYVVPLLFSLRARSKRSAAVKQRVEWLKETRAKYPFPERPEGPLIPGRGGPIRPNESQLQRFRKRMTRMLADIDYLLQAPLGWREGAVVVWAGMRGAVTVAAAQTLPNETPHRSLLVLIAFGVAVFSLLLQGGTLTPLIRRLKPATVDPAIEREEHVRIMAMLDEVKAPSGEDEPHTPKQEALATIAARRTVLLDARDNGTFSAEALEAALNTLDAEQIHLELQGDPQG